MKFCRPVEVYNIYKPTKFRNDIYFRSKVINCQSFPKLEHRDLLKNNSKFPNTIFLKKAYVLNWTFPDPKNAIPDFYVP